MFDIFPGRRVLRFKKVKIPQKGDSMMFFIYRLSRFEKQAISPWYFFIQNFDSIIYKFYKAIENYREGLLCPDNLATAMIVQNPRNPLN